MMVDQGDPRPGSRFLLVTACLGITIACLKLAAVILVPFVLACFVAVVTMPAMFGLRRRGVGEVTAIALTVLINVVVLGALVALVAGSLGALNERLPVYADALQLKLAQWTTVLEARGIDVSAYLNRDLFDSTRVLGWITVVAQGALGVFKLTFLVGLILIFILAEATVLPYKFKAIVGSKKEATGRWLEVIGEVQTYLWIKTLMSAGTGVGVGVLCWAMGVDFPVLMGLLAFALNFVPNIGSLLASIPAIALALVLHGPVRAGLLMLGYMTVNGMFGNLLETHILGKRMGLSPLVVVLSLLFWSWLWGPVGALLAVPLTMVLKITLEHVPDLAWIAVLMDKLPPQARAAAGASVS